MDESGEMCEGCKRHLDAWMDEPTWLMNAIIRAHEAGTSVSRMIARYLMVYHAIGHPTDDDIRRMVKEDAKREAAPSN